MSKILIVDDDKDIAELMEVILRKEQFEVIVKNDPIEVLKLDLTEFDLILLDIMMPELSGTELCLKIRDKVSCPIIFVSAKKEILDKMLGYETGGDDYITKPFDNHELVLKVKSHLRLKKRITNNNIKKNNDEILIGNISINIKTFIVKKSDKIVELTTREFELLRYFMENKDIALSKEQIFENVWGSDYGDIGTVAVNVKNLRDKVDPKQNYIITMWGYGYKFVDGGKNE